MPRKFNAAALAITLLVTFSITSRAQDLEEKLRNTAADSSFAVLPVIYRPPGHISETMVAGTGFLVNLDGYFVTAAHVLQQYDKVDRARMTVGITQRSGDTDGVWFDVIEKDEAHDLALCKTVLSLRKFEVHDKNPGVEQPLASLHVSPEPPIIGDFIAIAGFPLGSWGVAVQPGTIAALRTTNPNAGRVPAGQRELLQVSVPGNKGNSGSPVVELDSGEVIGVIVQAQPAPLFISDSPLVQSSGIMLAVPGTWVADLLKRNHVESEKVPPPKGHISYTPLTGLPE